MQHQALQEAAAALRALLPPGALPLPGPNSASGRGASPDRERQPAPWGFATTPSLDDLLELKGRRAARRQQEERNGELGGGAGGAAEGDGEAPLPPGYLETLSMSRTFAAPHSLDAMAAALGVSDLLRGMAGSLAAGDASAAPAAAAAAAPPSPAAPAPVAAAAAAQQADVPAAAGGDETGGGGGPPAPGVTAQGAIDALRRRIDGAWSREALRRGVAYAKAGELGEALSCYNKALQLDPCNADALVARGAASANRRGFAPALADFEAALRLCPGDANARAYLEATRAHMQQQEAAAAAAAREQGAQRQQDGEARQTAGPSGRPPANAPGGAQARGGAAALTAPCHSFSPRLLSTCKPGGGRRNGGGGGKAARGLHASDVRAALEMVRSSEKQRKHKGRRHGKGGGGEGGRRKKGRHKRAKEQRHGKHKHKKRKRAAAAAPAAASRLTTNDALTYLRDVKNKFADRKDVYDTFLEIMKQFKSQAIDTAGVIQRVKDLFRGHKELILGFNTFLPKGFEIQVHEVEDDQPRPGAKQPVEFDQAIHYVNKIKNRFSQDERVYKAFLEILNMYRKGQKSINDVYGEVAVLFRAHKDLLQEFSYFLPDNSAPQQPPPRPGWAGGRGGRGGGGRGGGGAGGSMGRGYPPYGYGAGAFAGGYGGGQGGGGYHKRKAARAGEQDDAARQAALAQELAFFDKARASLGGVGPWTTRAPHAPTHFICPHARMPLHPPPPSPRPQVKARLRSRDSYHDLLKLLNMHASDIIGRTELLSLAQDILGGFPDLVSGLRASISRLEAFDGWEQDLKTVAAPAGRLHPRDIARLRGGAGRDRWMNKPVSEVAADMAADDKSDRCTDSYVKYPAQLPKLVCSGRDALCAEVLNDEWVSVISGSEDYSFKLMRKNQYEEALFRCEDDRYELDMAIIQNTATIDALKPFADRLAAMPPDERAAARLPEGLMRAVHLRAIERIYGEVTGPQICDLLRRNPQWAAQVIIGRLEQKDTEWREVREEMNKLWRKVFEQNYNKSLDHRSFYFKQADKKALLTKAMLQEAKDAADGRRGEDDSLRSLAAGGALLGALAAPDLAYDYEEASVFEDAYQVVAYAAEDMLSGGRRGQLHTKSEPEVHHDAPSSSSDEGATARGTAADDATTTTAGGRGRGRTEGLTTAEATPEPGATPEPDAEEEEPLSALLAAAGGGGGGSPRRGGGGGGRGRGRGRRGGGAAGGGGGGGGSDEGGSGGGRGGGARGREQDEEDERLYERCRPLSSRLNVAPPADDAGGAAGGAAGGEGWAGRHVLYGNDALYYFLRFHHHLCDRLLAARRCAAGRNAPASLFRRPGDAAPSEAPGGPGAAAEAARLHGEFMGMVRDLLGANSYVLFTLDKLVYKLVKHAAAMVADDQTMRLCELYRYEVARRAPPAEEVYRANTHLFMPDDANCYRFELTRRPAGGAAAAAPALKQEDGAAAPPQQNGAAAAVKAEPGAASGGSGGGEGGGGGGGVALGVVLMDPDRVEVHPGGLDSAFAGYMRGFMAAPAGGPLAARDGRVLLPRAARRGGFGGEGEGGEGAGGALMAALGGVKVSNGLECKISCATSRVSYVLDTEDVMWRPPRGGAAAGGARGGGGGGARFERYAGWLSGREAAVGGPQPYAVAFADATAAAAAAAAAPAPAEPAVEPAAAELVAAEPAAAEPAAAAEPMEATALLVEWVQTVGAAAGIPAGASRVSTGALGAPESRLELEVSFDSMADWEAFLARVPAAQHRAWSQRVQGMVVDGSTKWEVFRVVDVPATPTPAPAPAAAAAAPAITASAPWAAAPRAPAARGGMGDGKLVFADKVGGADYVVGFCMSCLSEGGL
ncbi:MAG: hypothetical protein J3K34DRAFT_391529 [Monoraphidium minutum]|nr:MAG: hypothetical protein J3K34DRAFT_391529 [Monoraphidium minutum]